MRKDKIDLLCEESVTGREVQPENKRLHEVLNRIEVASAVGEYAEQVKEEILIQLNARIDKSARWRIWFRSSAAAAAILLLGLVSNYFSYNEGYKKQHSQLVTLENPLGMKSSVILPDGSKVILNAGTVLTYPTAFISSEREVDIKGEAFFEVAHDGSRPFVVKAEEIRIKVLGTKFNVKAYEEEENIEITLAEGKVGIGVVNKEQMLLMAPQQQVCFHKKNKTFSRHQVDLLYYTAWKEGKFYFNALTFRDIAKHLERSFNVHIHITSEKLKNTVFTGDFVQDENLEQILHVMTFDKRIKYKIEGNQVYVEEKNR